MHSIRLRAHVNSDGLLQIELPELKDIEVDVVVVYQPVLKVDKHQWSNEFLNTFEAWKGEPLVREPQGEQPERDLFL